MKRKTLLILMSSLVTVASATTVIFASGVASEMSADDEVYSIVLDGNCLTSFQESSTPGTYSFMLTGQTEIYKEPFSVSSDSYVSIESGCGSIVDGLGTDSICTIIDLYGYCSYFYVVFPFKVGTVKDAYINYSFGGSNHVGGDYYGVGYDDNHAFGFLPEIAGQYIISSFVIEYYC